jgi:hypothetical protein
MNSEKESMPEQLLGNFPEGLPRLSMAMQTRSRALPNDVVTWT